MHRDLTPNKEAQLAELALSDLMHDMDAFADWLYGHCLGATATVLATAEHAEKTVAQMLAQALAASQDLQAAYLSDNQHLLAKAAETISVAGD